MDVEYNFESLNKHEITTDQVDYVMAQYREGTGYTKVITWGKSKRGFNKALLVGFDQFGTLLEVGVEYLDNKERYYHARKAIKKSVQSWEREMARD